MQTTSYCVGMCAQLKRRQTLHYLSVFVYLQHAEAGSLDISSAVHVALHKVYAIFSQTRQQDALQVAYVLHLIG